VTPILYKNLKCVAQDSLALFRGATQGLKWGGIKMGRVEVGLSVQAKTAIPIS